MRTIWRHSSQILTLALLIWLLWNSLHVNNSTSATSSVGGYFGPHAKQFHVDGVKLDLGETFALLGFVISCFWCWSQWNLTSILAGFVWHYLGYLHPPCTRYMLAGGVGESACEFYNRLMVSRPIYTKFQTSSDAIDLQIPRNVRIIRDLQKMRVRIVNIGEFYETTAQHSDSEHIPKMRFLFSTFCVSFLDMVAILVVLLSVSSVGLCLAAGLFTIAFSCKVNQGLDAALDDPTLQAYRSSSWPRSSTHGDTFRLPSPLFTCSKAFNHVVVCSQQFNSEFACLAHVWSGESVESVKSETKCIKRQISASRVSRTHDQNSLPPSSRERDSKGSRERDCKVQHVTQPIIQLLAHSDVACDVISRSKRCQGRRDRDRRKRLYFEKIRKLQAFSRELDMLPSHERVSVQEKRTLRAIRKRRLFGTSPTPNEISRLAQIHKRINPTKELWCLAEKPSRDFPLPAIGVDSFGSREQSARHSGLGECSGRKGVRGEEAPRSPVFRSDERWEDALSYSANDTALADIWLDEQQPSPLEDEHPGQNDEFRVSILDVQHDEDVDDIWPETLAAPSVRSPEFEDVDDRANADISCMLAEPECTLADNDSQHLAVSGVWNDYEHEVEAEEPLAAIGLESPFNLRLENSASVFPQGVPVTWPLEKSVVGLSVSGFVARENRVFDMPSEIGQNCVQYVCNICGCHFISAFCTACWSVEEPGETAMGSDYEQVQMESTTNVAHDRDESAAAGSTVDRLSPEIENVENARTVLQDLVSARSTWHPPLSLNGISVLQSRLASFPLQVLTLEMHQARSAGNIAAIRDLQNALENNVGRETNVCDLCPWCQEPLTPTSCVQWPGPCQHLIHGQCLVNYRAGTRHARASRFSCLQCRGSLADGGLDFIDNLDLVASVSDSHIASAPSLAQITDTQQRARRAEPGSPGSPLPRVQVFCCQQIILQATARRAALRGEMALPWSPRLDHRGNVLQGGWDCLVCGRFIDWQAVCDVSQVEISQVTLERVGSCLGGRGTHSHRPTSPSFRVRRRNDSFNVYVSFSCSCLVSQEAFALIHSGHSVRQPLRNVFEESSRGQTQLTVSRDRGATRPVADPRLAAPTGSRRVNTHPPLSVSGTFSCIYIALFLDACGLLTTGAHDAWAADNRGHGWWGPAVENLRLDRHNLVLIDTIFSQALFSDYCYTNYEGDYLGRDAIELLRLWRLAAQQRASESISLQNAMEFFLANRERFRTLEYPDGYLPGEIQEALLTIWGGA